MPLRGRGAGMHYGAEYVQPGGQMRPVPADAIQEYALALEDAVVRMRPNPKRDNGLVIRMQGGERVGNPELLSLVELRALYKQLLEQGYGKM